MGLLQQFEHRLDRLVNGAFARAFRSEVQPVEIAGALQRELDEQAAVVSRDRTVGPNTYTVELGPRDHERLSPYAQPLGDELAAMVREHADAQGYALLGPVEVELRLAGDLGTGVFRVSSATTPGVTAQPQRRPLHEPLPPTPPVTPAVTPGRPHVDPVPAAPPPVGQVPIGGAATAGPPGAADATSTPPGAVDDEPAATVNPRLVVHGTAYPLTKQSTTVGRGADVDIRIDDPGVSRKHASFHLGEPVTVLDLASTNGTWVRGSKVSEAPLSDGDEVRLGSTTLVFRTG